MGVPVALVAFAIGLMERYMLWAAASASQPLRSL